jgi:RecA/RadA recombinase
MGNLVSTGIPLLDDFLQGGIPAGKITHVYGPAGSGKTTFALKLAASVAQENFKVLFIDSGNQFDSERLRQICGDTFTLASKNIMVIQPKTFLEQSEVIDRLEPFLGNDVRLIIVDALTALYRRSLTKDKERTVVYHQELNRQIAVLLDSAKHHDIPLVLTNQVTAKPEVSDVVPVAPSILRHWEHISISLELEKPTTMGMRLLTVVLGDQSLTVRLIIDKKGLLAAEPSTTE